MGEATGSKLPSESGKPGWGAVLSKFRNQQAAAKFQDIRYAPGQRPVVNLELLVSSLADVAPLEEAAARTVLVERDRWDSEEELALSS